MADETAARNNASLTAPTKGTALVHGRPTPEPESELFVSSETASSEATLNSGVKPSAGSPSAADPEFNSAQPNAQRGGDDDDMDMDGDDGEGDVRPDPNDAQKQLINLVLGDLGALQKHMGLEAGGSADGSPEACLDAFRDIATKIHPSKIKGAEAKSAWERLKDIAKGEFSKRRISHSYLEELEEWDGDDHIWSEFTAVELPPPQVTELYKVATGPLASLINNPEDEGIHGFLKTEVNGKIPQDQWKIDIDAFVQHFKDAGRNNSQLLAGEIPYEEALEKFRGINQAMNKLNKRNHYPTGWVLQGANFFPHALARFRTDVESIRKELETADQKANVLAEEAAVAADADGGLIKHSADIHTLREALSISQSLAEEASKMIGAHSDQNGIGNIPEAVRRLEQAYQEYLQVSAAVEAKLHFGQGGTALDRHDDAGHYTAFVDYQWTTGTTVNGEKIIAYSLCGRGRRLLVENETDGRYIRYYISGSEAGKEQLAEYKKMEGTKNLVQSGGDVSKATARSKRSDFSHILWFPKTVVKKYNEAHGTIRCPTAHFPAVTKQGDVHMVSLSTLREWIGNKETTTIVNEACASIGIDPPWNVQPGKIVNKPKDLRKGKDSTETHGLKSDGESAGHAAWQERDTAATEQMQAGIQMILEEMKRLNRRIEELESRSSA